MILFQTPSSSQSRSLLHAVTSSPYSSGRSFQGMPVLRT